MAGDVGVGSVNAPDYPIKLFNDRLWVLAEDALGDGEGDTFAGVDALPGFEVVVLIVGGEGAVEGDVVADHLEPVDLGFGKSRLPSFRLFRFLLVTQPLAEARVDEFGEGGEWLVLGVDAVADEADEVGQYLDGVALLVVESGIELGAGLRRCGF